MLCPIYTYTTPAIFIYSSDIYRSISIDLDLSRNSQPNWIYLRSSRTNIEMESHVPMISSWTNEKHVQFLNTMEASFVSSMLENKGRRISRLDRHMPDTSDSTLDLIKTQTTKKSGPVRKMNGGTIRKTRRLPSQPFIASNLDQVVPQFEIAVVGDN